MGSGFTGPHGGRQISRWLTCSLVDSGDKVLPRLSLLESILSLVALERSSIEAKGALPIDCTLTIKSVKGLKINKYSVSVLEKAYLYLGFQAPFIAYL